MLLIIKIEWSFINVVYTVKFVHFYGCYMIHLHSVLTISSNLFNICN